MGQQGQEHERLFLQQSGSMQSQLVAPTAAFRLSNEKRACCHHSIVCNLLPAFALCRGR